MIIRYKLLSAFAKCSPVRATQFSIKLLQEFLWSQSKSGDFTRPRCFDYFSRLDEKDYEIIEDTENYVIRKIKCQQNMLKLDFTHVSTPSNQWSGTHYYWVISNFNWCESCCFSIISFHGVTLEFHPTWNLFTTLLDYYH